MENRPRSIGFFVLNHYSQKLVDSFPITRSSLIFVLPKNTPAMATEGKVRTFAQRSLKRPEGETEEKKGRAFASTHYPRTLIVFNLSPLPKQILKKKTKKKPIECLAAVAWEANKPLDVTEVVIAPPQKGEVRIKVRWLFPFFVLVFHPTAEKPER